MGQPGGKQARPWCEFELDQELSLARGLPDRPNVFRCRNCGFVTAPCKTDNARLVRRRCRWFDLKIPCPVHVPPCWCGGLGDVVDRALYRLATWWHRHADPVTRDERARALLTWYGRGVDWLEKRLTRKEVERPPGGCGCGRRKRWLNQLVPMPRTCRKLCGVKVPGPREAVRIMLVFPHGFGDGVQFTSTLRHLRKHRPAWRIDVWAKYGQHQLFASFAERVFLMDRPETPQPNPADYDAWRNVPWAEPDKTYENHPSTKVEKCLLEMLGIQPDPELWGYWATETDQDAARARTYLDLVAGPPAADGRYNAILLHYQGNSWVQSKNLDEQAIRATCREIHKLGYVPIILDWEWPFRSGILRDRAAGRAWQYVECPGKGHPLWGHEFEQTGNASALKALIERSAGFLGIDSGPEHLAAATSTPTWVVWYDSHPVNYYCPADNVVHVMRRNHGEKIWGDSDQGLRFFRKHYRSVESDKNMRLFLPELIRAFIEEREASGTNQARGGVGAGRM